VCSSDLRGSIAPPEPEPTSPTTEPAAEEEGPHDDHIRAEQQTLKDEYASLLVRSVQVLNQSGKNGTVTGLQIQMRQLQSDFDPERAGFSTFGELLTYAKDRNMIRAESVSGDIIISLPAGSTAGARQDISTAQYRMYLQERLRCQLPSSELRNLICQQAFDQIGFTLDDGGILLRDLSQDVADELAQKNINIPQPEIYKYLYSIYRARCFTTEPTEYGQYNPLLTGFRAQKQEWDDHFIGVQIKMLANEAGFTMYPDKLSVLFYENEGKSMHMKQLLNTLGIKYETG
jgi:hypothetical protein